MTTIADLSDWEKDPRLFLFTSLTAGSSHIVSATSRLETILKANRIPFHAVDVASHEKARKLWGRRASKKKLPGLVKEGYVIGVSIVLLRYLPYLWFPVLFQSYFPSLQSCLITQSSCSLGLSLPVSIFLFCLLIQSSCSLDLNLLVSTLQRCLLAQSTCSL